MEEEHKSKTSTSPWLTILALLTTVHTSVFILVTVYQFRNLGDLTKDDQQLNQRILKLQTMGHLTIPGKDSGDQETDGHGRQKRQTFLTDIFKLQEQILEQHCINKNKTCPSGEQGERGIKGNQGMPGEKGSPGLKGEAGENGKKGITGPKGLPGRPGVKGEQEERGIQGDPGLPGDQGPPGANGVKGEKGDPGTTGSKGERGEKGFSGVPGPIGGRGQKGDPGRAGLQGTKGEKGELGPRGPSGPDRQNNAPDGCDCLKKPKSTRTSLYRYQGPVHQDG